MVMTPDENPYRSRHEEITDDIVLLAENAGVNPELLDVFFDRFKDIDLKTAPPESVFVRREHMLGDQLYQLSDLVAKNDKDGMHRWVKMWVRELKSPTFTTIDSAPHPQLRPEVQVLLDGFRG